MMSIDFGIFFDVIVELVFLTIRGSCDILKFDELRTAHINT